MGNVLETERLSLRELTTSDTKFVIQLLNSPGWIEFIGNRNVNSEEEAALHIQKIIDSSDKIYWVVELKASKTKIGIITFIKRDYLEWHDIGFAFLPEFTNMGYAYEAAKTVLMNVIKNSQEPYILATTIAENVSSIKLLKKLGLEFSKEIVAEGEKLHLYSASTDKVSIDDITKSFFGIFTNKNNNKPDWNLFNSLCIPEIIITCKTGMKEIVYNLESFIEPRKKILSDGTLREFEETEKSGETKIINNIAQRYSEYRKCGILDGKLFDQKGNKLFQFVKTTYGWKISSVIWEDEPTETTTTS
ncbi:MAG: GNAT family N-acetyltransferase [Ignavibacteriales bacterium]|nr:GNAT family N-acetyltransferase [Ignavibacteriales bacterium]